EIWRKTISGTVGGSGEEVGWPVLGYLPEKNFLVPGEIPTLASVFRQHRGISCVATLSVSIAGMHSHDVYERKVLVCGITLSEAHEWGRAKADGVGQGRGRGPLSGRL